MLTVDCRLKRHAKRWERRLEREDDITFIFSAALGVFPVLIFLLLKFFHQQALSVTMQLGAAFVDALAGKSRGVGIIFHHQKGLTERLPDECDKNDIYRKLLQAEGLFQQQK